MNRVKDGAIVILIIFICFLVYKNVKLENQVLECKLESEKKDTQSLSITNKALEENVTETNEVIKRERKNSLTSIDDDLKWLREHFNKDKIN